MEDIFTNIKERVLQIAENKGIPKEKFFENINMSYGNFKGKSKETPLNSNAIADLFSIYPDLNLEWLLTGKGEMLKMERYKQEGNMMTVNEIHQPKIKSRVVDLQEVPLYELEATAGVNEVLGQGNLSVPLDYIKIPNLPKCDGALYVRGDSMYPLLKSGDIVMYKIIHDRQKIIWGEMYLVHIINDGDEYFFTKFVKKSEKSGYASFVSHNQHHQTIEFPIDSIKSLAIVQASVRINTQM